MPSDFVLFPGMPFGAAAVEVERGFVAQGRATGAVLEIEISTCDSSRLTWKATGQAAPGKSRILRFPAMS